MTSTQIRLWTVEEYHRMIEAGILTPDAQVEIPFSELFLP